MKGETFETASRPPVAVLFGALHARADGKADGEAVLDELAGLAEAAVVGVAGRLVQRLDRPVSATYLGSGKATELKELCASLHAALALADMDLSPAQVRNLTELLGVRVIDHVVVAEQGFFSFREAGELEVREPGERSGGLA